MFQKPLIAEKDITVYKVVENLKVIDLLFFKIITARTIYRRSKIRLGKTYKSELEYYTNIFKRNGTVEEGLHSFVNLKDCYYIVPNICSYNITDSQTTYFAFYFIIECIIPKGSEYYVGVFDTIPSIASSKLKYVRIVE